jgi:hypothetical protein
VPTLHPRQEIREALVAALTGTADPRPTAAGERVFETRFVPWRTAQLPAISVYATAEQVEEGSKSTAPRELTRWVSMTVDAVVVASENADDELDALCLEIETAIHADPTLAGKASDCILTSTELGTIADTGRPMAAAQLVYEVSYITAAPESADLEDLETIDTKYDLGGAVHPDNQAEDTLTGLSNP